MRKLPKKQNQDFINVSTYLIDNIKITNEESMNDLSTLSINLLKACTDGADEGDLNQLFFLHNKYKNL
jgi:predicted nucleic acid-binding protein